MDHQKIIENLQENVAVFRHLLQFISDEQACWKPGKVVNPVSLDYSGWE